MVAEDANALQPLTQDFVLGPPCNRSRCLHDGIIMKGHRLVTCVTTVHSYITLYQANVSPHIGLYGLAFGLCMGSWLALLWSTAWPLQ